MLTSSKGAVERPPGASVAALAAVTTLAALAAPASAPPRIGGPTLARADGGGDSRRCRAVVHVGPAVTAGAAFRATGAPTLALGALVHATLPSTPVRIGPYGWIDSLALEDVSIGGGGEVLAFFLSGGVFEPFVGARVGGGSRVVGEVQGGVLHVTALLGFESPRDRSASCWSQDESQGYHYESRPIVGYARDAALFVRYEHGPDRRVDARPRRRVRAGRGL